jgi:hypothetical protein
MSCYIVQADLELLSSSDLPPQPPKCWDLQVCTTMLTCFLIFKSYSW